MNKNEETKQAFMSTGAKKGFAIGCAEKVPENYSIVAMFFEKSQVEKSGQSMWMIVKWITLFLDFKQCKFPCVIRIEKLENGKGIP